MTHDELLALINDSYSRNDDDIGRMKLALRAVVDLHEPLFPPNSNAWCPECSCTSVDGKIIDYPCSTIQAIEKALDN